MTQQFLHDLQFGTRGPKQRRIGVTERMPTDSFRDSQLPCNWQDMALHDLLRQVWPPTLIDRAREHPALRRLIWRLAPPFAQRCDQIIVSGDRFLRAFCLTNANDILHDGARYIDLLGLEVHVSPFQREQLTPPQAGGYGQQDQRSFSKAQVCEQSLDFIDAQEIWRRAAFGALPNPLHGVVVAEVVTATVIEQ